MRRSGETLLESMIIWTVIFGIAGGTLVIGHYSNIADAKRLEEAKAKVAQELDRYGHEVTIVGFQLIRSGTKTANYTYHDYVVVENADGERKRL